LIILKQKPFEEILKALEGEKRVYLVGCADCATTCQVGGEDQLKEMKEKLEKAGITVTGYSVFDTACLRGEVRQQWKAHKAEMDAADSLLVMACGTGTQTIGDALAYRVHPASDSLFVGEVQYLGKYAEKCSACGQCILEITEGICPVTRCAKGLLNGPCGGSKNGKCETDPEKDCAWALIYNRLRERGKLDKMKPFVPPKDQSQRSHPRAYEWPKPQPQKVQVTK
jgi:ferredoxin